MQVNCLAAEQVEVVASVLRSHAEKNVAEYIRSTQGNGSLSLDALTTRLELLVEVARKAAELAPGYADRFQEFDLNRYLESARVATQTLSAA